MITSPKMLYHYCGLETFINILENKSLWLSDVRKSNDKDELEHLKREAVVQLLTAQNKYLKHYSQAEGFTYDFEAMEEINVAAESYVKTEALITWVFCLSEESDLLSQWRGYGDNGAGISIGFDFEYLNQLNTIDQVESKIMFSLKPIKYGRESAIDHFAPILATENIPMDFEKFKRLCEMASLSVFAEAPFYKNDSFAEEKEWRIALTHMHKYMSTLANGQPLIGDIKNYFMLGDSGYVVKDKQIISHVELLFTDAKKAIKEIIIGPKCNMTVVDMKLYLVSAGWLDDVKDESISIRRSKSSYR